FESLAPAGIGLAPALFQPAAEHHVKLLHAAPAAPAQSRRRLITAHIRWAPRWVDAVWPGGAPHLFRSFEFRSFEFVCYLQSGACYLAAIRYVVGRYSQFGFSEASPGQHHLLDLGNRLGRIQPLGAGVGAVHDGVAAIQTERILEVVQA